MSAPALQNWRPWRTLGSWLLNPSLASQPLAWRMDASPSFGTARASVSAKVQEAPAQAGVLVTGRLMANCQREEKLSSQFRRPASSKSTSPNLRRPRRRPVRPFHRPSAGSDEARGDWGRFGAVFGRASQVPSTVRARVGPLSYLPTSYESPASTPDRLVGTCCRWLNLQRR